ncbi:unnamed protein product, partial [Polarella glacialis]
LLVVTGLLQTVGPSFVSSASERSGGRELRRYRDEATAVLGDGGVGLSGRSSAQSPLQDDAAVVSGTDRRGLLALAGGAVLAALSMAGKPALAAIAGLKPSVDVAELDFSKLGGMLGKDFAQAQKETECKPLEEGEERIWCGKKEIAEKNKKAAAKAGKEYKEAEKPRQSGGSYGV